MINSEWYKSCWNLDIKNQSWVEDTENQVEFIIKTLNLTGKERILDLACGFGRHSLSFARRGFSVVGIDITKEYINDAISNAHKESLNAVFIHSDIRDISYINQFDVVLNLADGAIGYLETDEENLKIFNVISKALKTGGKHFMDICSAEHAEKYFPKRHWEAGEKALALAEFDWDKDNRRMLYGGWNFSYGEDIQKPNVVTGNPTRLYFIEELNEIFQQSKMEILATYSNYYGKPSSEKELQLMVYSQKK